MAAVVGAGDDAVDCEGLFATGVCIGVESVERPVSTLDGPAFLDYRVAEARAYAVVDAGAVGYDYGWSRIAFGLHDGVDGLLVVGSERD